MSFLGVFTLDLSDLGLSAVILVDISRCRSLAMVILETVYVAPAATYQLVVHWQCCQDVYLCCTSCNLPTGRSLAVLSRRLSMLHQLQPTDWSFTGSVVKTSIYVAPAATYQLVVHWQCCQGAALRDGICLFHADNTYVWKKRQYIYIY